MTEINNNLPVHEISEPKPRSLPWATILLGAGLLASFGVGLYQHMNAVNLRMEIGALQREVSGLRQSLSASDTNMTQTLGTLRNDLDTTKKETETNVAHTKEAARRQAEAIAARMSNKLTQRQDEQQQALSQQLDQVKSTADTATARLTDITSEVGTVRTDVASTRSDLDKTIADLHRTTGDMGVMSGLIATNSKELAALKELGDRDYFEFNLAKSGGVQRVGDIQVQLKKSDPKRNRFTLVVVADDKTVEKKDRNVNEPVQFYVTSKARQPYELVINEVKKDQVIGYLATPKAKTARRL